MKPTKYIILLLNDEKILVMCSPNIHHIQAVGHLRIQSGCQVLSAGWLVMKDSKVETFGDSPTLNCKPAEGDAAYLQSVLVSN